MVAPRKPLSSGSGFFVMAVMADVEGGVAAKYEHRGQPCIGGALRFSILDWPHYAVCLTALPPGGNPRKTSLVTR
jgi:hypothetical protein